MIDPGVSTEFFAQLSRVYRAAEVYSQEELAKFLGIRTSDVVAAEKRKVIPADWLVILMRVKNVHPEWVLTGDGAYFTDLPLPRYETNDEANDRQAREDSLRLLPARMLADELVRRVAGIPGGQLLPRGRFAGHAGVTRRRIHRARVKFKRT